MRRRLRDWLADQTGVAMIEATMGTVLLLFSALAVIQLTLVFHASLAAHTAALRAAREYALTESMSKTTAVYNLQTQTSLKALSWQQPDCEFDGAMAKCTVRVSVSVVLPGSAVLGGGGLTGPITVVREGYFPRGGI